MWMTLDEVAKYLRVSKDTVYRMAQTKQIPAAKLGNQWRFNKELVDAWMMSSNTEDQCLEAESINQSKESKDGFSHS